MSYSLVKNAYLLSGLNTDASQREVMRRVNEISSLLKINEPPKYENDILCCENFRTEESIKNIVHHLSSPKKKIIEYFFWFNINDDIDERAYGHIKQSNYIKAIEMWSETSQASNDSKSEHYKKNLAILYCLLMHGNDSGQYLHESIVAWKSVVDSDKYWDHFIKMYMLCDDLGTSEKLVSDFRNEVPLYLSDIYASLSAEHSEAMYFSNYYASFSVRSDSVNSILLNPIFREMDDLLAAVEELDVKGKERFGPEEASILKDIMLGVESGMNKLISYGLFEDKHIVPYRDRVAQSLRDLALDVNNHAHEKEMALSLLRNIKGLSNSSVLQNTIAEDIATISRHIESAGVLKPINDLIEEEKFNEAMDLIKSQRAERVDDLELQHYYDGAEKACLSHIMSKKYDVATQYFNNNDFLNASYSYKELQNYIYENLDCFHINKEYIDDITSMLERNIPNLNLNALGALDDFRSNMIDSAKETFGGRFEESILIFYIDSVMYSNLSSKFKNVKSRHEAANVFTILGWVTIWIYGLGLIFFGIAWFLRNKDT